MMSSPRVAPVLATRMPVVDAYGRSMTASLATPCASRRHHDIAKSSASSPQKIAGTTAVDGNAIHDTIH